MLDIPEGNNIYDNDHELVYLFKDTDQAIIDVDDIDDSEESPVISANTAIASLKIVPLLYNMTMRKNIYFFTKY